MKNWKKTMLITAGALLVSGGILCGIGFATGARSIEYHNGELTVGEKPMGTFSFSNKIDTLSLKDEKNVSLSGQEIRSISCDKKGVHADITIQEGSNWDISYQLSMPERFSYQVNDKELSFSYRLPSNTSTNTKRSERITITVPQGTTLEEIDLSASLGDLLIEGVNCEEINLDGSLSDISLKNLSVGELDLNGSLGDITAEGITVSEKVKVDGSMGDTTLDGTMLCDIEISSGMGNTTLILHGASLGDYDYNIDCGMGDVHIDGADISHDMMGSSYEKDNDQDREIRADGGMGDIKIQFKK